MTVAAKHRNGFTSIVAFNVLLWLVCIAHAADLVRLPVEAANRVALNGYRPAWASSANDRGRVNAYLPMQHLTIVLRRSPEQQVAFERLLAEQQDPSLPNFHHWLTPEEVGERFGASAHDIESVGA